MKSTSAIRRAAGREKALCALAVTLAALLAPAPARAVFNAAVPPEEAQRHVEAVHSAVRAQELNADARNRALEEEVARRNREALEFVVPGSSAAAPAQADGSASAGTAVDAAPATVSTLFSLEMVPAYVLLTMAALLFAAGGWHRRDRLPLR